MGEGLRCGRYRRERHYRRMATGKALPNRAPHLVNRVLAVSDAGRIHTTLDTGLQNLIELQLRTFTERSRNLGIHNGAVMLIDYRSMQVKGYAGSANYFDNQIDGQVNGLLGRRSPGSALKPFIYALAIDEGLIHPRTMLKDTRMRIAAYNPENYDHDFLGPIDATSALVRSRNVPAIEVANMLRPPGLYGFLKRAGIRNLREENFYGLALALGGAEVSMEELTGLYAMLANGGELHPLILTSRRRRDCKSGEDAEPGGELRGPRDVARESRPSMISRRRKCRVRPRFRGKLGLHLVFAMRGRWESLALMCSESGSGISTARRTPTSSGAKRQGHCFSRLSTHCTRAGL